MKKIIYSILIIVLSKYMCLAQNPYYPLDSANTIVYSEVISNNSPVYFSNDTFYVNSSTHFLHKYFNFSVSEDSIISIADTIIKKYTALYEVDTITHTTVKVYTQVVSFDWSKSIPYDSTFIDPPTTAYKSSSGPWDNCIHYPYIDNQNKLCFTITLCQLQQNQTLSWCSEARYTKIYEDNFEGDKIDLDHWRVGYDWGRENTKPNNPANSIALDRNVEVSNGTLKLKAISETSLITDTDKDGTTYPNHSLSAGVITSALSYGFGKYSMRAKVPFSVGVNPAYWILSPQLEIDGFEFFSMNRDDAPSMSIYSNVNVNLTGGLCYNESLDGTITYWGNNSKNRIFSKTAHKNVWNNLPDLAGNWYIFTTVYDPNYISWFIETDDHQQAWRLTYPYVQQQNNSNVDPNQNCSCTGCVVQVNSSFPGLNEGNVKFIINNSPWGSCDFTNGLTQQTGPYSGTTSIMEVDWVKIYVPDGCWNNVTESSGFFRATDHINRNHLTGNNVTLGGNGDSNPYEIRYEAWETTLPENGTPQTNCAARANNELALLDGFSVEEYALFEGTISYQGGNNGVPADCNNQTYWPQIYRTANNQSEKADSIINIINSKNVVIYPNPANDYLNISAQNIINKIEFYNSMGQLVLSENEIKEKININLLSKGMYIIKVYFENEITISKFIKESK